MPQHHSIRNATPTTPDLPEEVMELIFTKCGGGVPVVNKLAMLAKRKHRSAARIQACFKGVLFRHWLCCSFEILWLALREFTATETCNLVFGILGACGASHYMQTSTVTQSCPLGGVTLCWRFKHGLWFQVDAPEMTLRSNLAVIEMGLRLHTPLYFHGVIKEVYKNRTIGTHIVFNRSKSNLVRSAFT